MSAQIRTLFGFVNPYELLDAPLLYLQAKNALVKKPSFAVFRIGKEEFTVKDERNDNHLVLITALNNTRYRYTSIPPSLEQFYIDRVLKLFPISLLGDCKLCSCLPLQSMTDVFILQQVAYV